MDALELKDTIHFLSDFGDIHHKISNLIKSRLLLLDSDDPINSPP